MPVRIIGGVSSVEMAGAQLASPLVPQSTPGCPTIVALLPHSTHARLEARVQHTPNRVYGAGRGAATWLIAPARRVGAVCPLMLRKGILALLQVRRQEFEALCRFSGGPGRG